MFGYVCYFIFKNFRLRDIDHHQPLQKYAGGQLEIDL